MVDGVWRDLNIRYEIIKIKTENGIKYYNHTIRYTHRGPIMSYIITFIGIYDVTNQHISLSWVGFNSDHTSVMAWVKSPEVFNFEELKVLTRNGTAYYYGSSALAMTIDNHILFYQSGLNARRPDLSMGIFAKDGTSSKYDWLGTIPFEDRLFIVDPKRGYFATANNRPVS